jgi:hypothetical protein
MTGVGYYYHLVNVISLSLSRSDHIKRLTLNLRAGYVKSERSKVKGQRSKGPKVKGPKVKSSHLLFIETAYKVGWIGCVKVTLSLL